MHALSFRYGQRHEHELDGRRSHRARSAGVESHVTVDIDLRAFGGSALTDDIDVPKDRRRRTARSPSPTCRRATPSSSRSRSRWRRCARRGDIFIGVNALDYSGYPDCRPEYIEAFERMANLATKAGVEGSRPAHPHAAHPADQGADHPPRARARRRLLAHPQLLRPRRRGRARAGTATLPAAAARLRRGGRARSDRLRAGGARMTYAVKEIFYTLQGEGANTGRPAVFCRFAGLQPLDGPRAGSGERRLHVLRHRLRGHRRHRGRQVRARPSSGRGGRGRTGRREPTARSRPLVVCTGGEPLLQLDAALIDALHAAGLEIAVETNGTLLAAAGHRLDLREPEGRRRDGAAGAATS